MTYLLLLKFTNEKLTCIVWIRSCQKHLGRHHNWWQRLLLKCYKESILLARLHAHGMSVNRDKCKFFQSSVTYMGQILSAQGLSPESSQGVRYYGTSSFNKCWGTAFTARHDNVPHSLDSEPYICSLSLPCVNTWAHNYYNEKVLTYSD